METSDIFRQRKAASAPLDWAVYTCAHLIITLLTITLMDVVAAVDSLFLFSNPVFQLTTPKTEDILA